ncbi:aldo/keto reductase [Mycobacterium sp. URHB0021]
MTTPPADRMGIGLAALGRPAYLTAGRDRDLGSARSVAEMRSRTAEVLDESYAGGIRYIDVARSYGRAEEFAAAWLDSRPDVTDVEVASKWGYRYVGDWHLEADVHEVKDHTLQAFKTQLGETRAFLGDRLTLYQVHSVTEESPVLSDVQLQRALGDLRDDGIRLGLSTSGPRQANVIRAAIDIQVGGAPVFSSVQSTWNLLEPSAADALSEARGAGMAVVVKECFANGRLAPGSADSAGVRRAAQLADQLGVGLDQLAIAAAVHQQWASRVLSGAATVAQVESHLAGAGLALPPQVMDEVSTLREDPDEYWAQRSRRRWS